MPIEQTDELTPRKPLRLWPGVLAAVMLGLLLFLPVVFPSTRIFAILGGIAGGLVIVVWWTFFSRAPWSERLGAIVLMIVSPSTWATKRAGSSGRCADG